MIASDWVREEVRKLKNIDSPKMSSALIVKQKGYSNSVSDHLGSLLNSGNNIYYNGTKISLFSSAFTNFNSFSVLPENFHKVTTLFTARKSIKGTWINDKDEYISPNKGNI